MLSLFMGRTFYYQQYAWISISIKVLTYHLFYFISSLSLYGQRRSSLSMSRYLNWLDYRAKNYLWPIFLYWPLFALYYSLLPTLRLAIAEIRTINHRKCSLNPSAMQEKRGKKDILLVNHIHACKGPLLLFWFPYFPGYQCKILK